jgi:hypothetical protein
MTQRYSHLSPDFKARAVSILDTKMICAVDVKLGGTFSGTVPSLTEKGEKGIIVTSQN